MEIKPPGRSFRVPRIGSASARLREAQAPGVPPGEKAVLGRLTCWPRPDRVSKHTPPTAPSWLTAPAACKGAKQQFKCSFGDLANRAGWSCAGSSARRGLCCDPGFLLHHFPQVGARARAQRVPAVTQIMEVPWRTGQPPSAREPGPAPEVAVPQWCAAGAGED